DRAHRPLPRRPPRRGSRATCRREAAGRSKHPHWRGRTMSALRLSDLLHRDLSVDPEIAGVTADSRKVKTGWLFAALPGARADGKAFVPQALAQGAAAVISGEALPGASATVVQVSDPRRAYALAAAAFWGLQPKTVVAVTGTNGK